MNRPGFGLATEVVNHNLLKRSHAHFEANGVVMPTFAQLANPNELIPDEVKEALKHVDPDEPHPLNLFRVHWYNSADRKSFVDVPGYIALPSSLTGVDATILVAIGQRFPMITAHKVLAAYGCLAPRVATGQYDASTHRAIFPSTGNYCRGGVAITRLLNSRGAAVLPEGMSRERFEWLEKWVTNKEDIIRTYGTESNVKEIYDACNKLEKDATNFLFNQFADFGNYLVHWTATGPALHHIFQDFKQKSNANAKLSACTFATGSAGAIGSGDYLKQKEGTKIVAIEALECPTLLDNGFGEHNIQGIGDKHVPFIHNVTNTDAVCAISDAHTDSLTLLISSEEGRRYLKERRKVPAEIVDQLHLLGYSGFANVLGAIKAARYYRMGKDDVVVTVATDGAAMYASEFEHLKQKHFDGKLDAIACAETYGKAILGASTSDFLELTEVDKRRLFNLGYYTWVEQQGVTVPEFEERRSQVFWRKLRTMMPKWDQLIRDFNEKSGAELRSKTGAKLVLPKEIASNGQSTHELTHAKLGMFDMEPPAKRQRSVSANSM